MEQGKPEGRGRTKGGEREKARVGSDIGTLVKQQQTRIVEGSQEGGGNHLRAVPARAPSEKKGEETSTSKTKAGENRQVSSQRRFAWSEKSTV